MTLRYISIQSQKIGKLHNLIKVFRNQIQTMGLKLALVTYSRGRKNSVLVITVLTKPINMDEILTLFHMKLPCLDFKAELGCLVSF
jgi:hypothetical protein